MKHTRWNKQGERCLFTALLSRSQHSVLAALSELRRWIWEFREANAVRGRRTLDQTGKSYTERELWPSPLRWSPHVFSWIGVSRCRWRNFLTLGKESLERTTGKNHQGRDFPGGAVDKTPHSQMQRAQVWSLVRELDPTGMLQLRSLPASTKEPMCCS